MKLMIVAVFALLILGGGGAGAYFYFGTQKAEAALTDDAHEGDVKHPAKDEAHDPAHLEFVELETLTLPIVDSEGVSQVVSLVIALEVTDHSNLEKIEKLSPRLNDAFLTDMYSVLNNRGAERYGGMLPVEEIKTRLVSVSDHVLGEGTVHDVLLQVISQRPMR